MPGPEPPRTQSRKPQPGPVQRASLSCSLSRVGDVGLGGGGTAHALQAMASSPLAYSCSRDSASSQAASNDNAVDARLRPRCSSCFAGPSLNPRANYALCPPLAIAYSQKDIPSADPKNGYSHTS